MNQSFNLMTLGGLAAAVGLVIDDAIVVVENIVMHRDSGPVARGGHPQRHPRNPRSPGRLHHHPHRGFPAADLHHRRHRRFLPRPGRHGGHGAADFAGAGAHLDSHAQPLLHPQAPAAPSGRARTPCRLALMNAYARRAASSPWSIRWRWPFSCIAADRRLLVLLPTTPARDLLPAMDEGGFILDYIMPAGSSLEETNRVITHVEKILRATPGSGKHLAAHRSATWPGRRHRSQHRRYRRQAEARPQARRRGSDRRRARQGQSRPSPCSTSNSRNSCRT